ncbi:LysR family transcriptional regulator [Arenicella xantha]|uniref:LysR family transcriptional regulator n=1 Tax=Arenicella xantha TaxID=644221 RepID=A0A395JMN0_9GAMM|nr:LysR family transcriptional regulator [Arenicella xantha]RBP52911.1 LysR family transcriptional regulator [Arenicella xantha]
MDRITAAEVFVDVAYSGSFSATAQRLDMSRPMVTRYIEAMEIWLDVRLFQRTTRKVSLTSAGERGLQDIEHWLKDMKRFVSDVNPSDQLSDSIRISVSQSFGYSQVMPALIDFMQQHPKVRVDVDLQDTTADLVEERIDLAIRISSSPHPSLIGKPIALCKSVLVASEAYLASKPVIQQPTDLADHACLGYKNFERNIWHLSKGAQHESVSVDCRLTANEANALMYAAIHGAGIALLPTYLVNEHIRKNKLQRVLATWEPSTMKIYVLYSSRKHLSPTVRTLIDFLADHFSKNYWDVCDQSEN